MKSTVYCMFLQGLTLPVNSLLPPVKLLTSAFNLNSNSNSKYNGHLDNRDRNRNTHQRINIALEASVSPSPQLIEFQEPITNVTVVLIGSMHYNPTSVRLASQTVQELGQNDRLGSVVVESCDIRWNKTLELYDQKPFLKPLLGNEMRAAQLEAFAFNLPVVLGDQRINITSAAMKDSLKQTFIDLFTPPTGWQRFRQEVSEAWDEAVPSGDSQYLSALAFLDPKLFLALPVSLIRYPLAFLIRDPVPTSIAFALLFGLSLTSTGDSNTIEALMGNANQPTLTENTGDLALAITGNLALAILETVIFARLLLKPLLADRNIILAQSILQQCKLYQTEPSVAMPTNNGVGGWLNFLAKNDVNIAKRTRIQTPIPDDVIYAPGSILDNVEMDSNLNEKVVVAVLGMAHLNGVMKLLKEKKV